MTRKLPNSRTLLLVAGSGLAITLAGCKVDNRPLLSRDNPQYADAGLPQPGLPDSPAYGAQPYGAQPYPASYLPPARAYPYAERAYGYDRAFYDTPPDYGFAYGDEEPWVWEAADDSLMFAEPYGEDYRFYYYEPGADYPYFVRDDRYGYAYGDNGALVALFDAAGALISANDYGRYAPQARQYWSRGSQLYSSYGRGQRIPVDRTVWSQRAPRIAQAEQPWMAAPQRQPEWRNWRASAGQGALQRYEVRRANRAPLAATVAQNGWQGRQAMAPAAPGNPGHDNGRHLGWERGVRAGQAQAFNAPQPAPRFEHGHGFDRAAEAHGRDASTRAPAQMAPAPMPQQRAHDDGGHGRKGWNGGERMASAAPVAPQAPAAPPQRGGGGWHGGGHEQHAQAQPQPQPQAHPQPQPQAQPQNGGGHGQGHGGGQGEQKHGDDHGKHHGA